jgi:probable F420-dependent oxidoreductase
MAGLAVAISPMKIDAPLLAANALQARVLAPALEAGGYDGAYTFDGPNDPFLPLAIAAEHTERLQLMTAIAVAFARNPMTVAQLGNELQQMSQGRFVLGLGSQIRAHIEKRFSMPWSAPAGRMREFVQAVQAIWRHWNEGAPLNFRGEFYTHTLMPPLLSPGPNPYGPPRILLAGVGAKMIEVAGEVADGLLIHPFHSAPYLEECLWPALRRGMASSGRPREALEVALQLLVACGRTADEQAVAVAQMRSQIGFYASTPAYRPVLDAMGRGELQEKLSALIRQGRWDELGACIDDDLLQAVALVGTPAEVAGQIVARYRGQVERVSPTAYIGNPEVAQALVLALRQELQTPPVQQAQH